MIRLRNRRKILISSLAVALAISFIISSLSNSSMIRASSAVNGGTYFPYQEAGYDVCSFFCSTFSASFYVLSVQGSWVVPTLKCPSTGNLFAIYEVGMDFASGGIDIENGGGVSLVCSFGVALYFAWVSEAGSAFDLSASTNPVHPGDHMNAKISYNPTSGEFTVGLHDSNHVWTYKPSSYVDSTGYAYRANGVFQLNRVGTTSSNPLVGFGKLQTTSDYVTIAPSSTATTGTKGSIGHWFASSSSKGLYAVVSTYKMEDSDTTHILAIPSSITSTSTGFNIIWKTST